MGNFQSSAFYHTLVTLSRLRLHHVLTGAWLAPAALRWYTRLERSGAGLAGRNVAPQP